MELSIKGEIFHISEQLGPAGQTEYHFDWLNGPADGSYGFSVSRFAAGSESASAQAMPPPMTHQQLIAEAEGFIAAFYAPGGIGEQDFQDHAPAQPRGKTVSRRETDR